MAISVDQEDDSKFSHLVTEVIDNASKVTVLIG